MYDSRLLLSTNTDRVSFYTFKCKKRLKSLSNLLQALFCIPDIWIFQLDKSFRVENQIATTAESFKDKHSSSVRLGNLTGSGRGFLNLLDVHKIQTERVINDNPGFSACRQGVSRNPGGDRFPITTQHNTSH